jgi:hypothetical protein
MNSPVSSCKSFAFRHLSKTAVSIFSTIFLSAAYVEATLANTNMDSENVTSVFSAGSINPLWDHGLHSYLAYAQTDTGQTKVRVCETPLSANQADVQENTSINPLFEYSSDASCGVSEWSGEAGQLFKFTSATQLTDDQGFNLNVFETGMSITVQDSLDFSAFSNGVLRLEVLGSLSQSTNILISLNDNVGEDEFGNNGNHLSLLYTLESGSEFRVIEIDLESWLSENINFDITQVDAISLTNFGELTLKSIEFIQQTQDSSGGNGSDEVLDGGADGSSTDGSFSVPDFVGNWTLYQGPGALGVGPYPGDTSWWSINSLTLSERDCLFDDIYSFGSDGSFSVIQDGLTWVEPWQGVSNTEFCGSPVYPHDGSNPASFIYDEAAQTIILSGIGAYIGLPRVADGIPELSDPSQAPESITYNVVAKSANSMTLEIASSEGVYWTFKLVRAEIDGSTDGSSSADSVEMVDGFGGALVDGETFTYPAGAEAWAGFANLNTAVYPFTFANGGSITFTAAVAAGGSDTNVYFRFERLPYPDVDPSFNLDPVLIVGETEMEYTVTIPAQDATNTYASFLLYIVEQDQTVIIRDIVVTDDSGSTDSTGGETTGGESNDADPVISTVTVFDDGVVGSAWDGDIVAWDAFLPGTCINDGGAGCPSIDWTLVSDNERGDVLQVSHSDEGHFASLIFSSHLSPQDLSAFSQGSLIFDIKVLSGDSNISIEVLCVLPCRTSVIPIESNDLTDWETVSIPVERLVAEGLDLRSVDTGLIIFATNYTGTVFQLDNIRWELSSNGGSTDGGNADDDASDGGSTDGGSTDGGFSSPPLNIFSDGAVDPFWDSGINGYDSSIDWQECNNDGGQACPNIDWQIVSDDYRGDVLMVSHTGNQVSTGLYIGASSVQDLSAYAGGYFIYDIKIVAAGDNSLVSSRVNCWYPCTSGSMGVGTLEGDWKTEKIPVDFLVETGLDLSAVSSLVFDLTDDGDQNVVILLDKIRFEAANDDGSADGGTTDGFTDGGTTDGGSVDGGANERASIEMIEGFGGAVFDAASSSYTFPTGSEVWAGFANLNVDVYPFTFANGGSITFTAAVAAGGSDTNVYFRFERLPYPDVDPSFNLDPVLIVGETEMEYTVTIPAQDATNTYASFLLYIVEQDQAVIIKDIVVTDDTGTTGDGAGLADGGSTDGGFGSPPLNIFLDGAVDPFWDSGINGYDSSIAWYECNNDGGQACPSIDWQIVSDDYRGDVLMVSHTGNQVSTGLYIGASSVQDLSAYAGGYFIYDIKIVTAGDNSRVSSRVHCSYPCTSGSIGVGTLEGDWKTEKISVDFLVETGLDLSAVNNLVFDLTDDGDQNVVILLDKIRFEAANDDGSADGGTTDGGSTDGGSTDGGSTDGGSTDGGSTDDGSADGGTTDGGSTDGGSSDGGSTDGGSTDGGSTDGGSTDGGSTDGGSTDGGSSDGGSTDGGSTDGGSTDGGSTDGGSTDGGSTDGGSSEPPLSAQLINLAGSPMAMMGNSLQLTFNYDVDNNDNSLPGLGLRVHFDSSVLSFTGATALIDKDLMFAGSDALFDVDDYDNNLDTDSYVDFAWASIGGDWPSEILPTALIDMNFDVTIETIKQVTPIGFSYSSLPSGYRLIAEEYSLPVISGGWDIDRNGQADGLTDGLLFMRYAFGLRGYNLINGVVAPDASNVTESQIEAALEYAFALIGDIDGNGSVDALTDGLLLTRYLFGFTGDSLIDAIVAPDATRTSAGDIEAYIQSMMPAN